MIIIRTGWIRIDFVFFRSACFIYTRTKKRFKAYGGKNDEFVGKSRPRYDVGIYSRGTPGYAFWSTDRETVGSSGGGGGSVHYKKTRRY